MPGKIYTVYRAVPIADGGDRRPYIGFTSNLKERIRVHRRDYKKHPDLLVYSTMRANQGFDNYRFEIIAQFDSESYPPEGGAARLAGEMEGALVRELIPVVGCLNIRIPGRSNNEGHRDRYWKNLEKSRAVNRAKNAAFRARKKAARLANNTKTVV
jgi:hypothetical protein